MEITKVELKEIIRLLREGKKEGKLDCSEEGLNICWSLSILQWKDDN